MNSRLEKLARVFCEARGEACKIDEAFLNGRAHETPQDRELLDYIFEATSKIEKFTKKAVALK